MSVRPRHPYAHPLCFFFFFNATATTEIYTLSLHDALPISPDGRVLASSSEGYALSTPQPGWAEQDPEDWWLAAQACLERLPEGPLGLSGQMHGLVVLDAADRVLR